MPSPSSAALVKNQSCKPKRDSAILECIYKLYIDVGYRVGNNSRMVSYIVLL